jgi:undecaprenyl phosphate-alpha-L-ara4N flippase subunit ArnE
MSDVMTYVLLFFSIALSSTAQIFQKLAATNTRQGVAMFRSPYLWLSFFCLGVGLLLWLLVLKEMPVSQAYPMLSLSYIFVMLLARKLFNETISVRQWFGAALIVLGVSYLMGAS